MMGSVRDLRFMRRLGKAHEIIQQTTAGWLEYYRRWSRYTTVKRQRNWDKKNK